MSENYIHPDDAYIDRDITGPYTRVAVLRDEEGGELFTFSDDWTDKQIKHALDFANKLYARGFKRGQYEKAYQICAALGIQPLPPEEP